MTWTEKAQLRLIELDSERSAMTAALSEAQERRNEAVAELETAVGRLNALYSAASELWEGVPTLTKLTEFWRVAREILSDMAAE